jgi:hypothetical protein
LDAYAQTPETGVPTTSLASAERFDVRTVTGSWFLSGGMRLYPFAPPLGIELSGSLQGIDDQTWRSFKTRTEELAGGSLTVSELEQSNTQWTFRENANLDASVGYGRVRDATPVFEVILLEERLSRDGVLARPLSRPARQKLADLFSLQTNFSIVHQLPDKFFWREVERLLREDDALGPAGLAAYDVNHASEALVVARDAFFRRAGWFLGPVVSGTHQHVEYRLNQRSSRRVTQDGVVQVENSNTGSLKATDFSDKILLGGKGEAYWPLGSRTQLDLFEQAMVSRKGEDDLLLVTGSFRLQHLIAERWFAEAFVSHSRQIVGEPQQFSAWSANAGGAVSYFLEDFCRLDLIAQQAWNGFESSAFSPTSQRNTNLNVSLGITLGRGRLNAPGLFDPVHAAN